MGLDSRSTEEEALMMIICNQHTYGRHPQNPTAPMDCYLLPNPLPQPNHIACLHTAHIKLVLHPCWFDSNLI